MEKQRTNYQGIWYALAACVVVVAIVSFARPAAAAEQDTWKYKMVSSLEYSGQGQFKHRNESWFTVDKAHLSDQKYQYSIWAQDEDASGENGFGKISFVLDRANRELTNDNGSLSFYQMIYNRCAQSLKNVTAQNIGKTWKQSFDLSFLEASLPLELNLTVTAAELETKTLGKLIAVRALSEPFSFDTVGIDSKIGKVKCKVNSIYLFDTSIEQIYMSITVFEGTTNVNGFKEDFRHEVATYRTDNSGSPVNFAGLDKEFEKLVRKVGLTNKNMKISKPTDLPKWVRQDGLRVIGLAETCSALACEGAPNPVVTVDVPAGRMVNLQGHGQIAGSAQLDTVAMSLSRDIGPLGSMKIAVAPGIMGLSGMQAGAIGGGVAGGVAAGGGGGGGGGGARSPSTP